MVRQRIEQALYEAEEASKELGGAVFDPRRSRRPTAATIIRIHREAWEAIEPRVQRLYEARAAQIGVWLEVGDTGIRNRDVILVLDDQAEWFTSPSSSQDGGGWEYALQGLLDLD
jgi:hypothetical protein